jgi:hypothetical protein
LPRAAKFQEIFRLPSLCHIASRVEAYRAQDALTQFHNCQQFGHVWANYKQIPRCWCCGDGHLHKDCPVKETLLSHQHAVTASWRRERKLIPPITAASDMRRSSYRSGSHREHPRLQRKGVLLNSHYPRCLRGGAPWQQTAATTNSNTPRSNGKSTRSRETECPSS